MARSYDLSLLPALQEQAAFFKQQSLDLVTFCEAEYGRFLSMIDVQSAKTDNAENIENLEEIYSFAAGRLEALQEMMQEEVTAIEDWQRSLDRVAMTGDTGLWADVAEEMIEDGDFKADTNEFKAWSTAEMASLKNGVSEVLGDWQSAIEEGSTADLAKFIEALDDMEAEEAEMEDEGCCDDEECEDDECGMDADDCCGKQDPCCRLEDEEESE